MKILYCHNRYQVHSGEDTAFDFATGLLKQGGHQVLVFAKDNREIPNLTLAAKLALGAHFASSPRTAQEVQTLLEAEKPTVALVQNVFPLISPSVYYTLAGAGVPVVQMVFNFRFFCSNGQFYTQGAICERCLHGSHWNGALRRCFHDSYLLSTLWARTLALHRKRDTWRRYIRLFVVPDQFLAAKLTEGGLPAGAMRVIANPFDVESYTPSREPGEYGLFVGRLTRPKGIFTLLDAALRSSAPIKFVGDGEDRETMARHPALRQGKAELLGAVYGPELERLVACAAFVAVPSEWYDSLPMTACQAFASGKPVIASRINGIPEYVHHEENGLLFSPGNARELAAAMDRLFQDRPLQRRLGENARRTAETLFHPREWLQKMNAVLEEAAQAPGNAVKW